MIFTQMYFLTNVIKVLVNYLSLFMTMELLTKLLIFIYIKTQTLKRFSPPTVQPNIP